MNSRSKDLLLVIGLMIGLLVVVDRMSEQHRRDSDRAPARYEASIR